MTIAPDDLQVNQYVAVHSKTRPVQHHVGPRKIVEEPVYMGDDFPVSPGVPLRILAISLPFVMCSVLEQDGSEDGPVVIDIRSFHLTQLSNEFVDALLQFAAYKEAVDAEIAACNKDDPVCPDCAQ